MADKSLGVAVVLGIGIFLFGWLIPWMHGASIQVGSASVREQHASQIVLLVTAGTSTPSGSYESLHEPVGTPYVVPAGRTLYITGVTITADSATTTVALIGYGTAAVAATSTPPTGAIEVTYITLPAAGGLVELPLAVAVPPGQVPFARLSGPALWPSHVQLVGFLR